MRMFQLLSESVARAVNAQPSLGPPQQWLSEVNAVTEFTPDMWNLQSYERQRLFVYGEEMSSHSKKKDLLEDLPPICTAFTYEPFAMWKHNLGKETYPIVLDKHIDCEDRHWFKATRELRWVPVKGELYAIDPYSFLELDRYRQNGVRFLRKRVTVRIPYRSLKDPVFDLKFKTVSAWMYFGIPEVWEDVINIGAQSRRFDPVRVYHKVWHTGPEEKGTDYYHFTKAEYIGNSYKYIPVRPVIKDEAYFAAKERAEKAPEQSESKLVEPDNPRIHLRGVEAFEPYQPDPPPEE